MKLKALLLIMIASVPVTGQKHTSLELIPVEAPPPYETTAAEIEAGPHFLLNAHTNQSLGSQQINRRRFAAQFDVATESWEFVLTESGRYRIRGRHGELEEIDGTQMVGIATRGTEWSVAKIAGGDTYQIRGASGRVLEDMNWSTLSGAWVVTAAISGGSNQEWRIADSASVMTARPDATIRVRGRKGNLAAHSAPVSAIPAVEWKKDGDSYVYTVRAADPDLAWLWLDRTSDYDVVPLSAPAGWHFTLSGWFAETKGAAGDFALRSSWAPGPVVLQVIGEAGGAPFEFDPGTVTEEQHSAMVAAHLNRGSHAWAIGPSIPPGTDAQGIRKLARKWVTAGLAFVAPLLDESKDVHLAVSELSPSSDFEKQVLSVLCIAVVGQ